MDCVFTKYIFAVNLNLGPDHLKSSSQLFPLYFVRNKKQDPLFFFSNFLDFSSLNYIVSCLPLVSLDNLFSHVKIKETSLHLSLESPERTRIHWCSCTHTLIRFVQANMYKMWALDPYRQINFTEPQIWPLTRATTYLDQPPQIQMPSPTTIARHRDSGRSLSTKPSTQWKKQVKYVSYLTWTKTYRIQT